MVSELRGGAHLLGEKPRAGTGLAAMPLHLDEHGTFEAAGVNVGPDGRPVANPGRAAYVDATQLCEMIRQIVREELAAISAIRS